MQIQVTIDDELMKKALQSSDLPTEAAVIEDALRIYICLGSRAKPEDMFGIFPGGFEDPDRN